MSPVHVVTASSSTSSFGAGRRVEQPVAVVERRLPHERGERAARQRVVERLAALGDRERARVVVLVVDDERGRAVAVAERDVHDLPVPAGGAERGAGDPRRARATKRARWPSVKYSAFLLHVPPSTVMTPVQVSQPPLCGPPSGCSARFQLTTLLRPVAGDPEDEVARVPLERVGEELRRRVGRAVRAGALGEPHALVREGVLELGLAGRVTRVAVEGGAVDPARRLRQQQLRRVLGLGVLAGRRRLDVVRVRRPVVVVAEDLRVEPRAAQLRAERGDQLRLLGDRHVHARVAAWAAVLRLVLDASARRPGRPRARTRART